MVHSNQFHVTNRSRRADLTRHAQVRSQQRGLAASVVPVITAFGERSHDGHGGIRYLMTNKAMVALVRALGRNQQIDALCGSYVVVAVDDERTVITLGHRYS